MGLGENKMAEYTNEQLDELVSQRLAEATKEMFSKEDFEKKLQAETDRRVNSGIQTALEKNKATWELEFSENAKLTAEEKAKKDFEEKLNGLTLKEKQLLQKENELLAKNMFVTADIPESKYSKVINRLVTEDVETTTNSVQDFIDMFNDTRVEIETRIKSENSTIPKPNTSKSEGGIDKEAFNKMGYAEKLKFKSANPDLYKTFIN